MVAKLSNCKNGVFFVLFFRWGIDKPEKMPNFASCFS